MKLNKKGLALPYIILFGFVVAVLWFYVAQTKTLDVPQTEYIGELNLGLKESAIEMERALLYLDSAVETSVLKNVHFLAKTGGYGQQSPCGQYIYDDGPAIQAWRSAAEDCYPDDYKKTITELAQKELTSHLQSYESWRGSSVDKDVFANNEFHLFFTGNEIVGVGDKQIRFNIFTQPTKKDGAKVGEYTQRPEFAITTNYNVDEYKKLIEQSKKIVNNCRADDPACIAAAWTLEDMPLQFCPVTKPIDVLYDLGMRLETCWEGTQTDAMSCRCSLTEQRLFKQLQGDQSITIEYTTKGGQLELALLEDEEQIQNFSIKGPSTLGYFITLFDQTKTNSEIGQATKITLWWDAEENQAYAKFSGVQDSVTTPFSLENSLYRQKNKDTDRLVFLPTGDVRTDKFWDLRSCPQTYAFCIDSPTKIPFWNQEEQEIEQVNPQYRFALTIPMKS